ncbi:MAG: hypothetical protein KGZ80_10180 [Methylomonas sp.]|nr:hypothetical protein [Methylomonas sp.]PPD25137.1 MAG: hypothetical protein CTY22_09640 [Methylomonas sp.]
MKRTVTGFFSILLVVGLPIQSIDAGQSVELFFEQTEAVLLEELDNERGKGDIDIVTLNNATAQALLKNSTSYNNITGNNIIDSSSFSGSSGLVSVIQNSGNNVIIQDSTIINVTIVP